MHAKLEVLTVRGPLADMFPLPTGNSSTSKGQMQVTADEQVPGKRHETTIYDSLQHDPSPKTGTKEYVIWRDHRHLSEEARKFLERFGEFG